MKKLALAVSVFAAAAVPALAADLAPRYSKAPAIVVDPAYDWSGFYVGGHVGGGWGRKDWAALDTFTNSTFPIASFAIDGFLGGVQGGYRYQSGRWVFGVDGSFSWANIKGSVPCLVGETCSSQAQWTGNVTGQLGWAADRVLFYVKGGAAWVHEKHDISGIGFAVPVLDAPLIGTNFNANGGETRLGWLLGGGIAYAIDRNWSGFVEYNYMDMGNHRLSLACTPAATCVGGIIPVDIEQHVHVFKGGFNYKFGGPIVAKY